MRPLSLGDDIVSAQTSVLIGAETDFATATCELADVRSGPFTSILPYPLHVRFAPDSDRKADVPGCPFSAKTGSVHSQSINSSARMRSDKGTSSPSALT